MRTAFLAMSSAAIITAMTIPALAGHGSMQKANGAKVTIACQTSACIVKYYNKSGKLIKTGRSAGGRSNYKKLRRKFRKLNYR